MSTPRDGAAIDARIRECGGTPPGPDAWALDLIRTMERTNETLRQIGADIERMNREDAEGEEWRE